MVAAFVHLGGTRLKHSGRNPCELAWGDCDSIHGVDSLAPIISHVRLEGGSTGIELHQCAHAAMRHIQVNNVRGPYPRGQCVQLSMSHHALLEEWSCVNDDTAWTEDSISVRRHALSSAQPKPFLAPTTPAPTLELQLVALP